MVTFLAGCTLPQLPWQTTTLGALQVTSVPKATVFLDDKELGKTPYYYEQLPVGDHVLRLTSDVSAVTASWQTRIQLNPRVLTVVSRDLGPSDILSSGHVISLEQLPDPKQSEISIISTPAGAQINIDNNLVGATPVTQKDVKQTDHTIDISLPGYKSRSVKVQTVMGYRLMLNAQLAQALLDQTSGVVATSSAQLSATASSQTALPSATPISTTQATLPSKPRVKVLDTPTGWLNVRFGPSMSATVSAKVNPGEFYPYEDEQGGWVKIKYNNGQSDGWVSVQYVEKQL